MGFRRAVSMWTAGAVQGQLDYNKAEVGRLKRELERVEGERDRARDEAKK
jgi:hypothetical protein